MQEILQSFSDSVSILSGGSDVAYSLIAVWALGVGSYLLKGIPASLWGLIKRNFTTELTFNNAGYAQSKFIADFAQWVKPKITKNLTRSLSVSVNEDNSDSAEAYISMGYGLHFFFYRRRLFWLYKSQLESSGSERQKEQIKITTIGRSHTPFIKMFSEIVPHQSDDYIKVFKPNWDSWELFSSVRKRSFESLMIDENLSQHLKHQIQHFLNNRQWYLDNDLPHKLTYLLHGEPGTGKTSLIKVIASEFNMPIHRINISQSSDTSFEKLIAGSPKNSIILIEDIDSASSTMDRESDEDEKKSSSDKNLSLTGILNTLDGIVPVDQCLIFLTTNHLDKLDKAIYRKGRVDHLMEIKKASPEAFAQYIKRKFGEDVPLWRLFAVRGCNINNALLGCDGNVQKFIDQLREMERK